MKTLIINQNKTYHYVVVEKGAVTFYPIFTDPNATTIESINTDRTMQVYNLRGLRVNSMKKGLNIVRDDNGKVRKVMK